MKPCPFGDPMCPCQDGDVCHYVATKKTPAFPPPLKKQQGFIALPAMALAAIAAGVVIAGLGVALKVQSARLDTCKAEYATFKAEVKVLGEAAIAATKAREAADKEKKEKADVQNAKSRRDLDGIYAAYRSLRDQRAGGGRLPEAPSGSRRPDLACFDRAELTGSVGILEEGVPRITQQGDEARLDLDTAEAWAQGR